MLNCLFLLLFSLQSLFFGLNYNPSAGIVATPADSPGAGTYYTTTSVTITDSTGSSVICYRTDGGTPTAAVAGTCDSPAVTYSGAFNESATFTLKAIGTKAGWTNSSLLTSVYTFAAQCPTTIADLTFWVTTPIAGLNNNDPIATWPDASGNGYDLTATLTARPTYLTNVLNGLPVVNFNGSTNTLATRVATTVPLTYPDTMFLVGNCASCAANAEFTDARGTGRRLIAPQNDTTLRLYSGAFLALTTPSQGSNYAVMGGIFNSTSSLISYNGNTASGNAGNLTTEGVTISGFSAWLAGNIAELIGYSQALGTADRQTIEGYLAWKWGLQTSLVVGHPYKTTPPACGY